MKELDCPKCNGTNGLKYNQDETFYKMNSFWDCRYCGHIIYKHKGIKAPDHYYHTGTDERSHVIMITPRKKAES